MFMNSLNNNIRLGYINSRQKLEEFLCRPKCYLWGLRWNWSLRFGLGGQGFQDGFLRRFASAYWCLCLLTFVHSHSAPFHQLIAWFVKRIAVGLIGRNWRAKQQKCRDKCNRNANDHSERKLFDLEPALRARFSLWTNFSFTFWTFGHCHNFPPVNDKYDIQSQG